MILALLLACAPAVPVVTKVCEIGTDEDGRRTVALRLQGELGVAEAELELPLGREAGSLPVVVQLFGGWEDTLAPATAKVAAADAVTLRVALSGAGWGHGASDTRGPLARAAVALALRYAAGITRDTDDCRVSDRAPAARPGRPVLVALSNGGNLAVATLALEPDVPTPLGVVLWETPTGPQLINVEHRNDPGLYAAATCTLDPVEGLGCPFQEPGLLAADGAVCFDLDDDGHCADEERASANTVDPLTGRFATSPALLALALAAGAQPGGWDTEPETRAFWAVRDAAPLVGAAVAAHPTTRWMLLASQVDHVLSGLDDHPHVYALGQALQGAGAWVRLNPGSPWTGLDDDNAIGTPIVLGGPPLRLVSEAAEDPLDGLVSAAVEELAERADSGDWLTDR